MVNQSVNQAWIRKGKYAINTYGRFSSTAEDHAKLDMDTKKSVLKAASSVVCLRSYSGDQELFICSGFIIDCDYRCGTFLGTILTSATLLRCASGADSVADDLEVAVYLVEGAFFKGEVSAVDFHYNIAVIKISSDAPLPSSTVRFVEGCVSLSLAKHDCIEDSNQISLYPGEEVFALGRYYEDPYDIMVAPGKMSFDGCNFDCQELLKASCEIKKNGIGGSLINCRGEVVGINFYDASYTPFLPINIAYKVFEDLKKHGQTARPWIGSSIIQLCAGKLMEIEKVHQRFPHIVRGAIVKKVRSKSPAAIAGLSAGDVIIDCGGNPIGSCLELTEALWNKKGKPIDLVVVRESTGKQMNLVVKAVKTNPKVNRWPVPKPRVVHKDRFSTQTLYW